MSYRVAIADVYSLDLYSNDEEIRVSCPFIPPDPEYGFVDCRGVECAAWRWMVVRLPTDDPDVSEYILAEDFIPEQARHKPQSGIYVGAEKLGRCGNVTTPTLVERRIAQWLQNE